MSAKEKLDPKFVEQMRSLLGSGEAEAFFASLDEPSPVSVRLNRRKPCALPFQPESNVSWCDSGFYLAERPNFTLMPEFHAGAFYVQEAASMIYESIVRELRGKLGEEPIRVLDSCAAPGGKTTAVINALRDEDFVLANEYDPKRANILAENIAKWGFPNVAVTQGDTSRLPKAGIDFDIVCVDAPCSGEGMMRKEEKAVAQWSPGLIAQCSNIQQEILENVNKCLKPGGILIYSTCTYNREEDDEQIEWLKANFNYEEVTLSCLDGSSKHFYPHTAKSEGLFVAVLRKTEEDRMASREKFKPLKPMAKAPLSIPDYNLYEIGSKIHAWKPTFDLEFQKISRTLKSLLLGIEVAEVKGKDYIYSQQLALSLPASGLEIPRCELCREEALRYLHGDALVLPPEMPRGQVLVCHQGLPIGFVKNLGNRANNLYPKEWRIRQSVG